MKILYNALSSSLDKTDGNKDADCPSEILIADEGLLFTVLCCAAVQKSVKFCR
jgi:hypothetical protein